MSHRITTQTSIKNKKLAIQALKTAGMDYSEQGDRIRVVSGAMRGAEINLNTGRITGDTDYHSQKELGALRKYYSEAQIRERCLMEGHTVEERQEQRDGTIRLVCVGTFA
jgi:hypothetical protein